MDTLIPGYKRLIAEDIQAYLADFSNLKENLKDSPAYYQGEVIPFLYQPFFYTKTDVEKFQEKVSILATIFEQIIKAYLTEKSLRDRFGFSQRLEELIMVEPGYDDNFPMARFDIFYYNNDQIKFCEINTDGSSGMVKTNILEEEFLNSKIIKGLTKNYTFSYFELVDSWIDTLISCYDKFSYSTKELENIAIMDFSGYGMTGEFEYFVKKIKEHGYQAKIVDPRKLTYKKGQLYSDDFKIDLIYRRAVTTDLMSNYEDCQDLFRAYKDHAVCLVGSFRSQIIHDKLIFSILHSDIATKLLTAEQLEFIKEHIPYTVEVDSLTEAEFIKLTANKNNIVLKPRDSYGSQGVLIGRDYGDDKWQEKIAEIKRDNYLLQEFCSIPEINMINFAGDKLASKNYKCTLGLFLYQQEFKGVYTRAGEENVIASATGCYTQPNFLVE